MDYYVWKAQTNTFLTFETESDAKPYKYSRSVTNVWNLLITSDYINGFATRDELKEKFPNWSW